MISVPFYIVDVQVRQEIFSRAERGTLDSSPAPPGQSRPETVGISCGARPQQQGELCRKNNCDTGRSCKKYMKKIQKKTITTIILILIFLVGLSLLLYPTVSDYWNSLHQSRAISGYAKQVAGLDDDIYKELLKEAKAYNKTLINKADRFHLTEAEQKEYETYLNVPGTNVIGYIEIDKINCYLPIYHGTDDAVLQVGVGHLEGSSLPVGGKSTHSVISGHRGLSSARLFTDLDQMEEGDTFVLHVLDETLTYEVDQIRIVEPTEFSELAIEKGKDYCTLMTCTPYGINTHRLLVRGYRIENASSGARVTADAMQIDPVTVAPLVAVPVLILLCIGVMVRTRRRKHTRKGEE